MRMLRASMTLGVISAVGLLATLPDRKLTKEFLESEIKDVGSKKPPKIGRFLRS
jgi:hypothetical protein